MYKIETHVHTLPVSSCAYFTPEEITRMYKDAGYDTIFISDHFAPYHFNKLPDMTWQEKVELMYDCYLRAKAVGDKLGMHVLFSPEMSINGNHYLLYNTDLDFYAARDDFFEMTLEEFRAYSKAKGVFMVQAHPLRDGKCVPHPECVDGFEAINSHPRHENFDEQVLAIAKEHNLPISCGSDTHKAEDVGTSAMLSPYEIKTTEDYLKLLISGEGIITKLGKPI